MIRIIGGAVGGRRLRTPAGEGTRPTSDRVREALFSSLESSLGTLAGLRFLDVYAGSGAVGLEASSRGAAAVTLIERDRTAAALIRANAADLGLSAVTVLSGSAERLAAQGPTGPGFDVAFLDPPYSMTGERLGPVVSDLAHRDWLVAGATIVVERPSHAREWDWPGVVRPLRWKRYGDTLLWYGQFCVADPTSQPKDSGVR